MFRKYEDTLKQRSFCCDDARVGNNQNYWPELLAEKKLQLRLQKLQVCFIEHFQNKLTIGLSTFTGK